MTTKLTAITVLTVALCATTSAVASPYNRVPTIRLHGIVLSNPTLPSAHMQIRKVPDTSQQSKDHKKWCNVAVCNIGGHKAGGGGQ